MNSRRAASTTARSMRTGSSRKRTVGIADAANQAALEVLQPADVVDDRERPDVVEERVDGEVAAERVLFRRAVGVVALDRGVVRATGSRGVGLPSADASTSGPSAAAATSISGVSSVRVDLPAERRDLDRLRAELDVREPEAPPDDPAVAEQLLDLVRMRRGADVEVLRPAAEQQVADAAADEVRDVVVLVQL